MKQILTLLTLSSILLHPSSTLAGVFIDEFDDPAKTRARWEVIQLDWIVEDGHYWSPGQAGLTECPITLLDIEVEDGMTIEASCGDKGGGNWSNFAIIYAYKDEDLVLGAGAGVGNDQWRMFEFTPIASRDGAWGSDLVPGVPVKKLLDEGEFYNIRVEIDGRDITLSASSDPGSDNLNEGNSCTLPDDPTGRIGLGAAGASPMFDWLKVTAPSLSVSAQDDSLTTTWGSVRSQL